VPWTMPGREPVVQDGPPRLFTIGHSNVALQDFLDLLGKHQIEAIADVRSVPRSRYVPHFDAERLREALARCAISYVPLGRELGGRPEGEEFYDEQGHVLYGRLAVSSVFHRGIDRVLNGTKSYRVALLCSEEDPSSCHRHLLIGRVLSECGVTLLHIRGDGRIEAETDLAALDTGDGRQAALFDGGAEERQWRSTRSVLRGRAPLSSSAH